MGRTYRKRSKRRSRNGDANMVDFVILTRVRKVGNLEFVRANAKRGESANAVVQEIVLLKSVEEKGNQDA